MGLALCLWRLLFFLCLFFVCFEKHSTSFLRIFQTFASFMDREVNLSPSICERLARLVDDLRSEDDQRSALAMRYVILHIHHELFRKAVRYSCFIEEIVKFLSSGIDHVTMRGIESITVCCPYDELCPAFVFEGAAAAVVRCLDDCNPCSVVLKTLKCLESLFRDMPLREALLEHGVVNAATNAFYSQCKALTRTAASDTSDHPELLRSIVTFLIVEDLFEALRTDPLRMVYAILNLLGEEWMEKKLVDKCCVTYLLQTENAFRMVEKLLPLVAVSIAGSSDTVKSPSVPCGLTRHFVRLLHIGTASIDICFQLNVTASSQSSLLDCLLSKWTVPLLMCLNTYLSCFGLTVRCELRDLCCEVYVQNLLNREACPSDSIAEQLRSSELTAAAKVFLDKML